MQAQVCIASMRRRSCTHMRDCVHIDLRGAVNATGHVILCDLLFQPNPYPISTNLALHRQIPTNIGRESTKCGRTWAKFGPKSAKDNQHWSGIDQHWPDFGQLWPHSTNFDRTCPGIDKDWLGVDQMDCRSSTTRFRKVRSRESHVVHKNGLSATVFGVCGQTGRKPKKQTEGPSSAFIKLRWVL